MCSTRLICRWSAWKLGSVVGCFIKTKHRKQPVFLLLLARGAGRFPKGETLELGGRKEANCGGCHNLEAMENTGRGEVHVAIIASCNISENAYTVDFRKEGDVMVQMAAHALLFPEKAEGAI